MSKQIYSDYPLAYPRTIKTNRTEFNCRGLRKDRTHVYTAVWLDDEIVLLAATGKENTFDFFYLCVESGGERRNNADIYMCSRKKHIIFAILLYFMKEYFMHFKQNTSRRHIS
jgi:hypothetical protein